MKLLPCVTGDSSVHGQRATRCAGSLAAGAAVLPRSTVQLVATWALARPPSRPPFDAQAMTGMAPAEQQQPQQAQAAKSLRPCTLGSAVGLVKQAGELVALAHPVPKSGYKNPNAFGARPAFSSETTTKHFVKMVRAAADSTCEHKKLMPYRPNAPRNRPKETLSNEVGKRTSSCNNSQFRLDDNDPESRKPWRTTNQVFQASARVTDVVGLANSGISADVAARMHKTQGIYSP